VCVYAGSPIRAQVDLKLMILLPQPTECWDYRCVPPHPTLELAFLHLGDLTEIEFFSSVFFQLWTLVFRIAFGASLMELGCCLALVRLVLLRGEDSLAL
jgi:hypothetical protein